MRRVPASAAVVHGGVRTCPASCGEGQARCSTSPRRRLRLVAGAEHLDAGRRRDDSRGARVRPGQPRRVAVRALVPDRDVLADDDPRPLVDEHEHPVGHVVPSQIMQPSGRGRTTFAVQPFVHVPCVGQAARVGVRPGRPVDARNPRHALVGAHDVLSAAALVQPAAVAHPPAPGGNGDDLAEWRNGCGQAGGRCRSCRVAEHDGECQPLSRTEHLRPRGRRSRGPSAERRDQAVADSEPPAVTVRHQRRRPAELCSRALLIEKGLAAGVVDAGTVEIDDDVQRNHRVDRGRVRGCASQVL